MFGICSLVFEVSFAQPLAKQSDLGAYAIPFATEGNRIELEVVNSTDAVLKDVTARIGATPGWLTFEITSETIGALKPGEAKTPVLVFDIDEKAPIGEVTGIDFEIESATGKLETRTIRIEPEAPTELTLRGNYPNPFNPTTKIAYALPKDGHVEIEVFNAIGQRVTRLVNQIQTAGYQEATWNAAGVPSGVYFYAVTLSAESRRQAAVGKMLVVK